MIAPIPARAQSAEADRRYDEAQALLDAGKVEEACAAFEESNRLDPNAGALIQIGRCKEKLGKLASALAAFQGALARAKDPRKKQLATEGVAAVEPRVSRLTISVAPEARVEGLTITRDGEPVDAADHGRALLVDGGSYEIAASAPGYRPWSTTVRVAPERDRAAVTVPGLEEEAAPAGEGGKARPAAPPGEEPAGPAAPGPAEKRSGRTALKAAGFGLLGLSVASGAYVLYLTVAGPEADYAALEDGQPFNAAGMQVAATSKDCGTSEGQALRDLGNSNSDMMFDNNRAFDRACKANRRRWITLGVFWPTAVAGAALLYFAYRGDDKPSAAQSAAGGRRPRDLTVTPVIGPGGAGATLRFTW